MTHSIEILRSVAIGLYVVLGAAALLQWKRTRVRPAVWASATFGLLAAVVLVALALPEGDAREAGTYVWQIKGLIIGLVAFPYLLFRFAASFEPMPRLVEQIGGGASAVLVVWTLLVPDFPRQGDPQPTWALAYTVVFMLQWTVLFVAVTVRLWRASRVESNVSRKRTRLLAVGTAGLNVAVIVSGFAGNQDASLGHLVSQAISISSALLLLIGMSPPRILRNEWLRSDVLKLQAGMLRLMSIERPEQVAEALLPNTARLVGAESAAVIDRDGRILGTHGAAPPTPEHGFDPRIIEIKMSTGRLILQTGPYTSFFGRDELDMLYALSGVYDLAIERCHKRGDERRFIANAAHELRTPLTTLSGLSVLLANERHRMDEADVQECFEALARQGDRTRVLIENLLDLAQLEGAAEPIHPRPVHVAEIAERALESAPPPPGVIVRNLVDQGLSAVADEVRTEQMLVNLLTNAYRYGGAHISLEAFCEDDRCMIVVSDDGPGVPPELVPQLFEPFGRGSLGSHEGSGLGLAIVRRLAGAFGGDVRYEAQRPNGARFTIVLPRADVA